MLASSVRFNETKLVLEDPRVLLKQLAMAHPHLPNAEFAYQVQSEELRD